MHVKIGSDVFPSPNPSPRLRTGRKSGTSVPLSQSGGDTLKIAFYRPNMEGDGRKIGENKRGMGIHRQPRYHLPEGVKIPIEAISATLIEFQSQSMTGKGGSTMVPSLGSDGMPKASDQCSNVGFSGSSAPVEKLPSRKDIDSTIRKGNMIRMMNPIIKPWARNMRRRSDFGSSTMPCSFLARIFLHSVEIAPACQNPAPKAWQPMCHEGKRATIEGFVDNNLSIGLKKGPHSGSDRTHAGCGAKPCLCALKVRVPLRQVVQCRVGYPRIEVTLFSTRKKVSPWRPWSKSG